LGRGSVFTVLLPIVADAPRQTAPAAEPEEATESADS
jgi:hypothetical protein